MYRVVVHRNAARYLQRLPNDTKQRIKNTLQQLKQNPKDYPGAICMAGEWAGYQRLRIGKFLVIYWFDEDASIVYVDHVGPRGDVYK